ncbi:hypothetical protein D3C86_1724010 [compost metagenome]
MRAHAPFGHVPGGLGHTANGVLEQTQPARTDPAEDALVSPEPVIGHEPEPLLRHPLQHCMGNGQIQLQVIRVQIDPVIDPAAIGNEGLAHRGIFSDRTLRPVPGIATNGREQQRVPGIGGKIVDAYRHAIGKTRQRQLADRR